MTSDGVGWDRDKESLAALLGHWPSLALTTCSLTVTQRVAAIGGSSVVQAGACAAGDSAAL